MGPTIEGYAEEVPSAGMLFLDIAREQAASAALGGGVMLPHGVFGSMPLPRCW